MYSIATLLVALTLSADAATPYTLEDLRALAAKSAWTELVAHLADIPPTKRDDAWKAILEQSATGYLQVVAAENNGISVAPTSNELLNKFPDLKSSPTFMKKRGELGLAAFENCFADRWAAVECNKHMTAFVNLDPKNVELMMQAGKLARRNVNQAYAINYFAGAVTATKGAKECSDADLSTVALAALGLQPDAPEMALGRRVADACYDALKNQLSDKLAKEGPDSYYFKNVCPLLKAKGDLKGLMARQCKA